MGLTNGYFILMRSSRWM